VLTVAWRKFSAAPIMMSGRKPTARVTEPLELHDAE
jgi:hypothetical protein